MKQSKCKNKPFWFDSATGRSFTAGSVIPKLQRDRMSYWDSLLEFRTYNRLCRLYPEHSINRQFLLTLVPASHLFSAITWKIDFAIVTHESTCFYETKGQWIRYDKAAMSDFCKLLRIFHDTHPNLFKNLTIVSDERWKVGTTNIFTLPITKL